MEGKKYDGEKPKMYLLPPKALLEVSKVLTFGAAKYDEHNWKKLDNLQNRYSGAALRHIFSHIDGEEYDDETGLDHLAHAICCLMFKLEAKLETKAAIDELTRLGQEIGDYGTKGKEEGLRESIGHEHKERDPVVSWRDAYHQERSLRNPEYSIQYNPPSEDYRGISREEGVCKEAEESAPRQTRLEFGNCGDSDLISAWRKLSRDSKA